jgi:hypothetical protein
MAGTGGINSSPLLRATVAPSGKNKATTPPDTVMLNAIQHLWRCTGGINRSPLLRTTVAAVGKTADPSPTNPFAPFFASLPHARYLRAPCHPFAPPSFCMPPNPYPLASPHGPITTRPITTRPPNPSKRPPAKIIAPPQRLANRSLTG